ncbi:pre-mRNA processing RNA-helicase [Recurvomyces mirabilis]|nr:pre-mRNA processing RNA-helicase [Recurvomyces mirabilis]
MARSPGRRTDDRYDHRDDRGSQRHSRGERDRDVRYHRSRSPPRRELMNKQPRQDNRDRYHERDRDHRPRSRSRDRRDNYDDRRHRDRRGDRDRKHSRDREPVRDRDRHHRSSRYGDDYDDRDRKRPRRDSNSSPPPRGSRGPSRDRGSIRSGNGRDSHVRLLTPNSGSWLTEQTPRPPTADEIAAKAAEEANLAKLAKVAAWKKSLADKMNPNGSSSGNASPAAKTEGASSPSPAVRSPSAMTKTESPRTKEEAEDEKPATTPPASYSGKFDHKAIAKRAAAKMAKMKGQQGDVLGSSAIIPKQAETAHASNLASQPDASRAAPLGRANGTPATAINGNAKVSSFGLNKTVAEKAIDDANAAMTDLGGDEDVKRKLERLPDEGRLIKTSRSLNVGRPQQDEDDDDDLRSDEEEAAAAREAALNRARATQEDEEDGFAIRGASRRMSADVPMKDEEDEVDELDAFMEALAAPDTAKVTGSQGRKQVQVFSLSDDEDELEAVGDGMDDISAMAAKRKRKEIPAVNHAKVQYPDFRKAFYTEPVEHTEMSKEDVDILRADLDNITCLGGNAPTPITKFSQGGFGAQILDVIRGLKFEKPTPVQAQTLPAIMSGRDTIGIAKTGSGKTVAYLLPMFRHIKDQPPLDKFDGPIGLVLAPTRELATQIHRDCKPYLRALNLRAVCAYGGAPIKDQIAELKRGAEIVICTPGRMIDLLAANSGRVTNLKRITYVVLDEADRMYDMGFEPQIAKILVNIRPDRQTVLFSATLPKTIEAVQKKALNNPLRIMVGGRSVVADTITQIVEVRTEDSKFRRVLELLGELTRDENEDARCLIFVERQETADKVHMDLNNRGYPALSIHGGREQVDRDQALSDFKSGALPIMVATSVAARGLDVKQLKLVINFDAPNHLEDYVHRAGRTGRAGNLGTAVTFVRPDQDRFASFLIRALKDSKREVPSELVELDKQYREKVSAGEVKKISGAGFGGRGIERIEEARNAERAIQKRTHKTGDEADDEEDDKEEKPANKKQTEVEKMLAKATGQVKDRDAEREQEKTSAQESGVLPSALALHLSQAMRVEKRVAPEPTKSVATGSKPGNDRLARVAAAAANINSRLGAKGAQRPGIPVDNRGPDAGAFHATLEINDFPQKARWAVTNRTNVAKILESTGTSITTKGNFYATGKEPAEGELPKLYILVEGDTEVVVEQAMRELTRLLREGTVAALEAEAGSGGGGRYSVV